jgi:hypothetical protein
MASIVDEKKLNSKVRIEQLRSELSKIEELRRFAKLAVFVAGSYARNEASVHSDIDLFFVFNGDLDEDVPSPRINSMRAFAKIIEVADNMGFPAFSNDGEFLKILESPKMARELGGRDDDHLNYFTARMLMLLESSPVFNSDTYERVLREVVGSYFRDYTHRPDQFKPIFLINDILRFWKTLCLNYEHKRNQPDENPAEKAKQKAKNFKLKFSRLLTCFGSIASIIDHSSTIGPEEVVQLVKLSPFERLQDTAARRSNLQPEFQTIAREYEWFLATTNVSGEELLRSFGEKGSIDDAFRRAEAFGDSMFRLVRTIGDDTGYTRYLII